MSLKRIPGGVNASTGFSTATAACGIKRTGPLRSDLCLVVSDLPASAAGVFTTNLVKAAPVLLSRRHLGDGRASAILLNSELCWREAGPDALAVNAGAGETLTEVVLSLDNDGRIVRAFAPDRPRSVGTAYVATPWRGHFTDYRLHEGRWIPFAGEVAWEIDGKPEVYWQGTIKTWACV